MSLRLPQPAAWEAPLLDWAYTALESHRPARYVHADHDALRFAYEHCAAITKHHSRTFYIASGLLPREKRRAARALYAFCRVTDDLIDQDGEPALDGELIFNTIDDREVALRAWRELTLDPHPPADAPVALAWADTRARFGIPDGYAQQLIDGVARDLDQTRYETFDDLAAYSYGVASTVGLMAMHVIGFAGERAIPYAIKLGVALQVTNILRDIAEDWRAGRLYLPAEDLAAFGLSEADIDAGCNDARWAAFMRFQIERTRNLYTDAMPGIALLNVDGRFAIAAAAELYRAILGDIEAHQYDVFTRRAHIGAADKLRRLPGIWWRSRTVSIG